MGFVVLSILSGEVELKDQIFELIKLNISGSKYDEYTG